MSSRGKPNPLRCARSSRNTYTVAAMPMMAMITSSAKNHHAHTGMCADHSEKPGGVDGGGHDGGQTIKGGTGGKVGGARGGVAGGSCGGGELGGAGACGVP